MNTLITGNVKYYSQTGNKEFIDLLKKYPPYKPEEEIEAFKRFKNGDNSARDEIILHNQRWVYSLAKEYARDEIEVMDYVSEGNFGLMEAVDKFDYEKGFKFITFAVWYIRRSMNSYLVNEREMVTKPNNAKIGKKVESIKNDFFVKNGRTPTNGEIKNILKEKYDISIKNESDLYDLVMCSTSDVVNDDTTLEESDKFNAKTATDNKALDSEDAEHFKDLVGPILGCLPEKQREFIKKLYHIGYGEEYTMDSICTEYGLDESGLKNMENNILKYMKQEMLDYYKKAI